MAWPAAKREERQREKHALSCRSSWGQKRRLRERESSWPGRQELRAGKLRGTGSPCCTGGPGVRPSAVRESAKWAVQSVLPGSPPPGPRRRGSGGRLGRADLRLTLPRRRGWDQGL